MLNWNKIRAAANGKPNSGQLWGRGTLAYLHSKARPRNRHQHSSDQETIDCTAAGFGIRKNRLEDLLADVAYARRQEMPVILEKRLRSMLGNSKRSFRQKQNAA